MQTKALNVLRTFSLVLLLFCFTISADRPITRGTSDQQPGKPSQVDELKRIPTEMEEIRDRLMRGTSAPLQPIQHKELMRILAEMEKAKDGWEVHKKFQAYPRDQRLETLAYALKEGINSSEALQEIINDPGLLDRRLTPFMSKVIQKAEGHELFRALIVVNRLPPDQTLLAPLMDALQKDEYFRSGIAGSYVIVQSSFVEAANAIYQITNGKIGLGETRNHSHVYSDQEKQDLIKKWRQTYNAEYRLEI
jgi:hypothetical protein